MAKGDLEFLTTEQLPKLRLLLPLETTYDKYIKDDIPTAQKALDIHLASVPAASTKAQQVSYLH